RPIEFRSTRESLRTGVVDDHALSFTGSVPCRQSVAIARMGRTGPRRVARRGRGNKMGRIRYNPPQHPEEGTMASQGQVAALAARRTITVHEFPVPDIDDESILLGIGLSGVCGSDLHRFQDVGETIDLPL